MSKKVVNGVEISDDIPVTEYDGKFSGTFELDVEKAASMAWDDTVYFVVTTRLDKYTFAPTKFGDLKRINTFKVDSVRVVKPHELDKLHQMGYEVQASAPKEELFNHNTVEQVEVEEPDYDPTEAARYSDPGLVHRGWQPEVLPTTGREYKDPILKNFLEEIV